MQSTRLFQILYVLLAREGVTAAELARRFEVSTRTIYRDIDALSAAGIPVYAAKGKGGGIRLMEDFVLSRSLLSEGEQQDILLALQSMNAARVPRVEGVIDKLGAVFNRRAADWVAVDFADWGSWEGDVFSLLKEAIVTKRVISFDYSGSNRVQASRRAEPLQLWFKHRSWYLRAWCLDRAAPRLFKLSRMQHIRMEEGHFARDFDEGLFTGREEGPGMEAVDVTLDIAPAAAYRAYDEFGGTREVLPDGSIRVRCRYIIDEWIFGYLLSFGPDVKVIEPALVREEMARRIKKMQENL